MLRKESQQISSWHCKRMVLSMRYLFIFNRNYETKKLCASAGCLGLLIFNYKEINSFRYEYISCFNKLFGQGFLFECQTITNRRLLIFRTKRPHVFLLLSYIFNTWFCMCFWLIWLCCVNHNARDSIWLCFAQFILKSLMLYLDKMVQTRLNKLMIMASIILKTNPFGMLLKHSCNI